MKISLIFIAIYIGIIFVSDVFSQKIDMSTTATFRRFEILVTGLRHKNYYYENTQECCTKVTYGNCDSPCDRFPLIKINNLPEITRPPIFNVQPPPGGDYVYNNVWEDDDDANVFKDYLNVSIAIIDASNSRVLGSGKLDPLRFSPNSDRQFKDFPLGQNILVNIHLSYWCRSYTGYNCQFKYDEKDKSVETNFETGEKYCVNGNIDPNNCNNPSDSCITNICQNNGECHRTHSGNTYCICENGSTGQFCEHKFCVNACNPDFGVCVDGKCECQAGWESLNCSKATCNNWKKCQNNGECTIKLNTHICNCDPLKYSGEYCEHACPNECIFGTCFYDGKNGVCVCYEGYEGVACNEITAPLPAFFESGYVPKYKQTAIIVGCIIGLIIIAIFVLGLASYLRKNASRNLKVAKRAMYVVNTLQRESAMNPSFNGI